MNIVLIRSNPVRPYPRLEKMANCLLKRGYGIRVLAWDRDSNYEPKNEVLSLPDGEATITRIGIQGQFSGGIKKNLKGLLGFQRFIHNWLETHKDEYDVVHSYDLDTGFTAERIAKKLGKIFIYDIPDYYSDSHGYTGKLREIIRKTENKVIDHSFATIICTEERKVQIKEANPQRLVVVHNTPDIRDVPSVTEMHDRLKIVYVGIFGKKRFVQELAETVAKRNDCELHIGGYGAGMESYFEEMDAKCDNITYYGRIPYQTTLELEKNCDVMFAVYSPEVPNHRFAAPNKFYEALALGKPLIMAKNTGMATIVEEQSIGETIEYTLDGLRDAIDKLIARRTEWGDIGRREQEMYKKTYSWVEMEKRIYKLYDEVEKNLIRKGKRHEPIVRDF